MKKVMFLLVALMVTMVSAVQAQNAGDANLSKPHKIIFQLTTADSLSHKALMKQLNNITSVSPETKVEVVCHGPGLNMLMTGKTTVHEKIQAMTKRGVVFVACEFSMTERNVTKEQIIAESVYTKAGILYIVSKMEEGYNYIKSGF
jgi:intracellular sulfur oxidation DsrE/DsrF family protein